MMRLPDFRFVAARSVEEAVDVLASYPPGDAMVVAGGTDLLPNMKRRQQTPRTLVGLRRIASLREIRNSNPSTPLGAGGLTLGAGLTLTELLRDVRIAERYTGLYQAAAQVATPHLRNMGTLGGNICLDTRCNYYDQNYEWRKAIDFCMKKDGATCWVATSSPRCLAVSSTDTAPALMSLDAQVMLASATGARTIALADLYRNDGIHYLTRQPGEVVTAVCLPRLDGWRSTYLKLRRRGSFDFPVLSVAAAVKLAADGTVEDARLVVGAVASRPQIAQKASAVLVGQPLNDAAIAQAAELAAEPARPMDNTDFTLLWRKRVTRAYVAGALRELRDGPSTPST
jgi:4-hydroxybenzoyl-CoA reductase subunit beta